MNNIEAAKEMLAGNKVKSEDCVFSLDKNFAVDCVNSFSNGERVRVPLSEWLSSTRKDEFKIYKTPRRFEFEAWLGEYPDKSPEIKYSLDSALGHYAGTFRCSHNSFLRDYYTQDSKWKVTMEEILPECEEINGN